MLGFNPLLSGFVWLAWRYPPSGGVLPGSTNWNSDYTFVLMGCLDGTLRRTALVRDGTVHGTAREASAPSPFGCPSAPNPARVCAQISWMFQTTSTKQCSECPWVFLCGQPVCSPVDTCHACGGCCRGRSPEGSRKSCALCPSPSGSIMPDEGVDIYCRGRWTPPGSAPGGGGIRVARMSCVAKAAHLR